MSMDPINPQLLTVARAAIARAGWAVRLPEHGDLYTTTTRRDALAWVDYARAPTSEKLAALHATVVHDCEHRHGFTPAQTFGWLWPDGSSGSGFRTPLWLALVLEPEVSSAAAKQWHALSKAYIDAHEKAVADVKAERERKNAEHRERVEREAEERRLAAPAVREQVALRSVDRQIEIDVRQAESSALTSEMPWRDHPTAVRWDAWVADTLEFSATLRAKLPTVISDACDPAAPQQRRHADVIEAMWQRACERGALPIVLDLSGFPTGVSWLACNGDKHLAAALKRRTRGITILVARPVEAWALERVLRDLMARLR